MFSLRYAPPNPNQIYKDHWAVGKTISKWFQRMWTISLFWTIDEMERWEKKNNIVGKCVVKSNRAYYKHPIRQILYITAKLLLYLYIISMYLYLYYYYIMNIRGREEILNGAIISWTTTRKTSDLSFVCLGISHHHHQQQRHYK